MCYIIHWADHYNKRCGLGTSPDMCSPPYESLLNLFNLLSHHCVRWRRHPPVRWRCARIYKETSYHLHHHLIYKNFSWQHCLWLWRALLKVLEDMIRGFFIDASATFVGVCKCGEIPGPCRFLLSGPGQLYGCAQDPVQDQGDSSSTSPEFCSVIGGLHTELVALWITDVFVQRAVERSFMNWLNSGISWSLNWGRDLTCSFGESSYGRLPENLDFFSKFLGS